MEVQVDLANNAVLEPGWAIPVVRSVDVVVAGGGVAGIAAAVAALLESGGTRPSNDAIAPIAAGESGGVTEATGVLPAGIKHALGAIARKRHVILLCNEADVLPGRCRRRRRRRAKSSIRWPTGTKRDPCAGLVDRADLSDRKKQIPITITHSSPPACW